ncbi:ABC transporter ATP-binding protein [Gordonia amicalis]|uniref:ABC transporter ATP-binding protein n=1 Tax=Gordonia amicalis TaxID=89053 RepID=A0ABU4DHZ3_9ACTN|nr:MULTISPECIES: ABC transporter ATP-binding protein [Gordonia]ATD72437.1 ABC transporter ATP-binding protein [Gordonia sp. 1D]MBA5848453.1 ABC transporter ATP-binding protein [Gordonia amicalis]MDV6309365.1 ABC transporter ATP-binding protein [Gordonia amicalis]MDV7101196.1 ABC transporter ATP-binding protein [Gordonia amicalis]MDV7175796.1 ABC transporter ATP-binding protein [Gordonia amicalis]
MTPSAPTPSAPTPSATPLELGHPLVGFEHAELTYPDGTHALRDVNLTVREGEFVSVVGPSGCGKSTLLRLSSGLETITDGYMQCGADRIGYVFQDATLLPWRSVADNVALLGELDGVPKAERRQRIAAALETVGLNGFEDHLPHMLSGGMRMRVSLARSLTLDPDLFLFDEPFAALDELTRERLGVELTELFAVKRFAGLFITHSVAEAAFLSTRVLVMSGRPGTIVDEIEIPFDFPRSPDLRFEPEFAAIAGRISRSLREAHS